MLINHLDRPAIQLSATTNSILKRFIAKTNKCLIAIILSALAPMAAAVDFDITIDNITRGLYFTPIAVVAHAADVNLFASGVSASTELQTMAETGEIEDLARVNQGQPHAAGDFLHDSIGATNKVDGSKHSLV
jgi:hypothetical protein